MSHEDLIRYSRMISLPEIGSEGIAKLKNSKVAVIGCGALGSLCSMYLAGAGVGHLVIADYDTIDISNLQRQLFYETGQAGLYKAQILEERINALNSSCKVERIDSMITASIAADLFKDVDFIIDATDNPASKSMTDEVCFQSGTPYCIGGVSGFKGQVVCWEPGCTRYSEIFNPGNTCGGALPCSVGGVMGPAAGVIASIQASEAIKHLTGCGEMLYNKIFMIDLLTMQTMLLDID